MVALRSQRRTAVVEQLTEAAFYAPAVASQSRAGLDAGAGDARNDVLVTQPATQIVITVAFVSVQLRLCGVVAHDAKRTAGIACTNGRSAFMS